MARQKAMVHFVAVIQGDDRGMVKEFRDLVKRVGGVVHTVEEKTHKGKLLTGVGISIPKSEVKVFKNLCDSEWTLHEREAPPKGKTETQKVEKVKAKPSPAPSKKVVEEDEDGWNTGDPELDSYLEECERRGCSYGECLLLVPTKAKPSAAFVGDGGYYSFHRGACPKGANPRLPEEVQ